MLDRWFYTLAGMTYGPVPAAYVHSLVADGKLARTEHVWPEGFDVQLPVPAFSAMAQSGKLADWLDSVHKPEKPAAPKSEAPLPSWLMDVHKAERLAQNRPAPAIAPAAAGPVPAWLDDVRRAESTTPARPQAPPPTGPQAPVKAAPPVAVPAGKRAAAEVAAFVDTLQKLQLLKSEHIDEVSRDSTRFGDTRTLAADLVQKGRLTSYQADLLSANRGQELVVGSYRIRERLGEGGMGVVFKAWHVRMDRIVALKIIAKDRFNHPRAIERFFREARAAAQLQHPNIVLAYDADQAGATHYFAMEYVEGTDLKALGKNRRLPLKQVCDYMRQAALGLQHAYERGVVHRDIKPTNILVTGTTVKILDFGLARLENDAHQMGQLTHQNTVVGTVDYMAPEQAQHSRGVDIRADIYSLGCTFFFLLTGRPPFEGNDYIQRIMARVMNDAPPVTSLRPDVPPALDRILTKMLARKPDDRYQTPAEVAMALEPFC